MGQDSDHGRGGGGGGEGGKGGGSLKRRRESTSKSPTGDVKEPGGRSDADHKTKEDAQCTDCAHCLKSTLMPMFYYLHQNSGVSPFMAVAMCAGEFTVNECMGKTEKVGWLCETCGDALVRKTRYYNFLQNARLNTFDGEDKENQAYSECSEDDEDEDQARPDEENVNFIEDE